MDLYDTGINIHDSREDITGNLLIESLAQAETFRGHDKFIVVLTSGFEEVPKSISDDGLFTSYTGYQRYFAAQKIYFDSITRGEKPLLIISGGKIKIGDIDNAPSLSAMMERELVEYHNIPPEDIVKEEFSRDTVENAKYVLGMLSMHEINKITLVTSENHLPRAIYIFKKKNPNIDIEGISAESVIQKTNPIDIQKQRREKDRILDKQIEIILKLIYRLPGGIGIQLLNRLANSSRNTKRV